MCFSSPSAPAQVVQAPTPPPPPPNKSPTAPEIDAQDQNTRDASSAARKGTSIFRNDLAIPSGGAVGNGINIPK
jgi:hypothetical protein